MVPRVWLARIALPRFLTAARALFPALPHVVVTSTPPTEGNAIETVRALLARYEGEVCWFGPPPEEYAEAMLGPAVSRVRRVDKASLRGLWLYTTAEGVFFTHGLYGEPAALARKPTINLWHGQGMKGSGPLFPLRTLRSKPSDVIVGYNELWGYRLAQLSGLSSDEVVFSGHPRNDQLQHPCPPDALSRLGIDALRPFVLWMPTFRATRGSATSPAWRDSGDTQSDEGLTKDFSRVVQRLAEAGVSVVVKPHPLDAMPRETPGSILIDDRRLMDTGVGLYSLLGASSGLITDSSAVWADYLLVDRPIGFFFPDLETFRAARGFYPPDVLDWLPGPFLDGDGLEEFVGDVLAGGSKGREQRVNARSRAGVVLTDTASDDLLDALIVRMPNTRFVRHLRPRSNRAGLFNSVAEEHRMP